MRAADTRLETAPIPSVIRPRGSVLGRVEALAPWPSPSDREERRRDISSSFHPTELDCTAEETSSRRRSAERRVREPAFTREKGLSASKEAPRLRASAHRFNDYKGLFLQQSRWESSP